jgi:hypothetical protein
MQEKRKKLKVMVQKGEKMKLREKKEMQRRMK